MLIYSMSASLDGFIVDRDGRFDWSVPSEEQFRFHLDEARSIGAVVCGRGLYEAMLPWETDPSLRDDELGAEFAELWNPVPKVVFSRTLDRVEGNARLATRPLADEIADALVAASATDRHVEVGGAGLAGQAIELGLVDEFRVFRNPVIVGGGTPLLPAVAEQIDLELLETRVFAGRVVFERYRLAGRGRP
ncbi:dihydrofolate reductase family protein [Agromyces sp. NPDC058136]|uniref:dihydrofolate reductase family protein n=1 Tax=Agromyces sp. NPDC058136 TaxID=3346354 RepID=UPI0036DD2AF0